MKIRYTPANPRFAIKIGVLGGMYYMDMLS